MIQSQNNSFGVSTNRQLQDVVDNSGYTMGTDTNRQVQEAVQSTQQQHQSLYSNKQLPQVVEHDENSDGDLYSGVMPVVPFNSQGIQHGQVELLSQHFDNMSVQNDHQEFNKVYSAGSSTIKDICDLISQSSQGNLSTVFSKLFL